MFQLRCDIVGAVLRDAYPTYIVDSLPNVRDDTLRKYDLSLPNANFKKKSAAYTGLALYYLSLQCLVLLLWYFMQVQVVLEHSYVS